MPITAVTRLGENLGGPTGDCQMCGKIVLQKHLVGGLCPKCQPNSPGTLKEKEPHPASLLALEWLRSLPKEILDAHLEGLENLKSSDQEMTRRLGEVCHETLSRFSEGKPVSDRYTLGLVYFMGESMRLLLDGMLKELEDKDGSPRKNT